MPQTIEFAYHLEKSNYFSPFLGCINQFVKVEYSSLTSTIVCHFLSETDTSMKSCSIIYGQCGQMLGDIPQVNSTAEIANSIVLNVDPDDVDCYIVIANNETVSVIVEGKVMIAGMKVIDNFKFTKIMTPIKGQLRFKHEIWQRYVTFHEKTKHNALKMIF